MTAAECDVLIAGGGLVGLSLALALSGSGLRVTLVDPAPLEAESPPADERHLALSEVTCRILDQFGVLAALGADAAPIRSMHVSSAGEFGVARWAAADVGRTRFGVVAPARRLLRAMQQKVLACADLCTLAPAQVLAADPGAETVAVSVRNGSDESLLRPRLLVIADGANSTLRAAAGIDCVRHDYQRHAICCVVTPERDHDGCAYERFTRSGPVALLPQAHGRCGAVLVVDSSDAARLTALPEPEFLRELQAAFGYRLGRLLHAGERISYPLRRVLAERLTAPRQVLIGNAAQAIHPVGAQGFNLGLRDAATLAGALRAAGRGGDVGADALLQSYAKARQSDRAATTGLSHALAEFSGLRAAPARWIRTLALMAADRVEPLREHLMLGGMGYRGATPALARGELG